MAGLPDLSIPPLVPLLPGQCILLSQEDMLPLQSPDIWLVRSLSHLYGHEPSTGVSLVFYQWCEIVSIHPHAPASTAVPPSCGRSQLWLLQCLCSLEPDNFQVRHAQVACLQSSFGTACNVLISPAENPCCCRTTCIRVLSSPTYLTTRHATTRL